MRRTPLLVAALVVVIAACGGSSDKPLTAADHAACQRALSYATAYQQQLDSGVSAAPQWKNVLHGPEYGLAPGDQVRAALDRTISALPDRGNFENAVAGLTAVCGEAK